MLRKNAIASYEKTVIQVCLFVLAAAGAGPHKKYGTRTTYLGVTSEIECCMYCDGMCSNEGAETRNILLGGYNYDVHENIK